MHFPRYVSFLRDMCECITAHAAGVYPLTSTLRNLSFSSQTDDVYCASGTSNIQTHDRAVSAQPKSRSHTCTAISQLCIIECPPPLRQAEPHTGLQKGKQGSAADHISAHMQSVQTVTQHEPHRSSAGQAGSRQLQPEATKAPAPQKGQKAPKLELRVVPREPQTVHALEEQGLPAYFELSCRCLSLMMRWLAVPNT